MKFGCDDLKNVLAGVGYGYSMAFLGGLPGGVVAKKITEFSGISGAMGVIGDLVTFPITYGTAAGILGTDFIYGSALAFTGTSYTTYPINVLGTLLEYAMLGSEASLGEVCVYATISSAFLPIATTFLMGGGNLLCRGINYYFNGTAPSSEDVSTSAISEPPPEYESSITLPMQENSSVNTQTEEELNTKVAQDNQAQLLEEGRLSRVVRVWSAPLQSPRQLGIFPSPASQYNSSNQPVTMAPSI